MGEEILHTKSRRVIVAAAIGGTLVAIAFLLWHAEETAVDEASARAETVPATPAVESELVSSPRVEPSSGANSTPQPSPAWEALSERFYQSAAVIEQRESQPDAMGRFTRVKLLEADFKYPLIRLEEEWQGGDRDEPEFIVGRVAMVANHLVVRLGEGNSQEELAEFAAQRGGTVRNFVPGRPLFIVELPSADLDAFDDSLDAYSAADGSPIAYSEVDYIVHALAQPNDTMFSQLWGLHNTSQTGGYGDADIDAPEAWSVTTGDASVVVGVIDTGIDYNHPDIAANMWINEGETANNGVDDDGNGYVDDIRGWNFVSGNKNPWDDQSHGTHCAGTIGAVGDNGIGVVGVAHEVRLMALKFLSASGSGSNSDAVSAIYYATDNGADLTSNSWGGGGYSQSLKDAIADARNHDLPFIAAAGNDSKNNDSSPSYPASYTVGNIISVAATDHRDFLASFSNYGANSVDLSAPGVDILSSTPGNSYDWFDGTSMAAPHVAGAAALLKSLNPSATWQEIKADLLDSVDPVPSLTGRTVTGGRLNVATAVIEAAGALLTLKQTQTSDVAGDGNGVLNPGEEIELTFTIKNAGGDAAPNVTSVMSTTESGITIVSGSATLGTIGVGAEASNANSPFRFRIASSVQTPRVFGLMVTSTDSFGNVWEHQVELRAYTSSTISGGVTDIEGGAAIAAATVHYAGALSGAVPVAADGSYTIEVIDGSYTLMATAEGYIPSGIVLHDAPPSVSGIDFALGASELVVTPAEIVSTQTEETVTQHTVTITNNGSAPLDFAITASVGTASSQAQQNLLAAAAPLARVAAPLDPGDLHAAAPSISRDVSIASTSLPFQENWEGGSLDGWVLDGSTGTREVVSDVVADGSYSFHYAHEGSTSHYQGIHRTFTSDSRPRQISFLTRSGSASQSDAYFVIGDTIGGWDEAIWFYASDNGRFFLNDETVGDNSVPYTAGRWYSIAFQNIDWDSKTFDYYVDGILIKAAISFREPGRISAFSRLHLYSNTAGSESWWDEISITQDELFWLNTSQSSGTVAPGGSTTVTVGLDTDVLRPGTYTASLLISSNDPNTPAERVPVTLNVTPIPNDPPVAAAQTVTLVEDIPKAITLSGSDPDGNDLKARVTSLPSGGRLYQTPDGVTKGLRITGNSGVTNTDRKVIFEPDTDGAGSPYSSFQFTLNDERLDSAPATVTINVTPVNDAPLARNDQVGGVPGQAIETISVLANDLDPDDVLLTIVSFTQGALGTVSDNGDGTLRYIPDASFTSGGDHFDYTIVDAAGLGSTATVSVRIGSLAGGDWEMYGKDSHHSGYYAGSANGRLLGEAWSITGFTDSLRNLCAADGQVFVSTSGYYKELSVSAYSIPTGVQSWSYDLGKVYRVSAPAYQDGKVLVNSSPVSPPAALLTAIDAGSGDLAWELSLPLGVDTHSYGVTHSDGTLYFSNRYKLHAATPSGTELYQETVPGSVSGWAPTIAEGQAFTFVRGILRSHDLSTGLENWSLDIDSSVYSSPPVVYIDGKLCMIANGLHVVDIASQSIDWSVTGTTFNCIAAANGIVYAADNNGRTVDIYDLATGDPLGDLSTETYGASQIIVTDDTLITTASSRKTWIYDLNGHTLTQTLNVGGTLAMHDGALLIGKTSSSLSLHCYVFNSPTNSPPVANAETFVVTEDTVGAIALSGTDPENAPLQAIIVSLPSRGTLYQTSDGETRGSPVTNVPALVGNPNRTLLYEPDQDAYGVPLDSFTFKVNDGVYSSPVATATVDVPGVQDAPIATDDNYYLRPGEPLLSFRPELNDRDPDIEPLQLVSFTSPSRGTLTQNPDGSLRFVPASDFFSGTDTFSYVVRDGADAQTGSTVTITVDDLFGRSWLTYGGDAEHTGFTPLVFPPGDLVQKWQNDRGAALHGAVIAEGQIVVAAFGTSAPNDWVLSVDEKTGAEVWFHGFAFDDSTNTINPPSIADGRVFLARDLSFNTRMWALDAGDGEPLWDSRINAQTPRYMAPVVSGNTLWTNGGTYGGLYGYNKSDGAEKFFVALPQHDRWAPVFSEGKLYSSVDGTFRNHSPTTGETLWSLELESEWGGLDRDRTVSIGAGRAYLIDGSNDSGDLVAIDLASQSVAWREEGVFGISTPAFAEGVVYAIEAAGDIRAFDPVTGISLKTYETGDAAVEGQPLITTNRLFVASKTKTYVFELGSETPTQTISHGGVLSAANHTLYIAGNDGVLRAFAAPAPDNSPPVAGDIEITILEEASVALTLESADADGDDLSTVVQTLPSGGRLFQTSDGVVPGAEILRVPALVTNQNHIVLYQTPPDQWGQNLGTFQFVSADDDAASAPATAMIHVEAVNDPPIAYPDSRGYRAGQVASPLNVRSNDFDADGDPLAIVAFTQPASGLVAQNSDGSLRYEPDPVLTSTTVTFDYTISDAEGVQDSALVTLTLSDGGSADWPTFGNGPAHTGYTAVATPREPWQLAWSTIVDSGALHPLAIGDGLVYATPQRTIADAFVSALDTDTGAEVWNRIVAPDADSIHPPTFADGVIYVQRANHNSDTHLWALHAGSGETKWSAPHGAQFPSYFAPCVADGGVWVNGGTYGGMYGFDIADGSQRFFVNFTRADRWTPGYYDGGLYSCVDGTLRNHDPDSGVVDWSIEIDSRATERTLAFEDDRAYLVTPSSKHNIATELICVGLSEQAVLWSVPGDVFGGTPAVNGDTVYALDWSGIVAVRVASGEVLARFEGSTERGYQQQPLVSDGHVFAASDLHTDIYDRHTAALVQTLPVGGFLSLTEGQLFIAGHDGTIYCYQPTPPLVFFPGDGTVSDREIGVTVTASAPTATRIHYTLDGSLPNSSSPSIAVGGQIAVTSTATLTAVAAMGSALGTPASASYIINDSDADGLPDGWETDHFGDLISTDGTIDSDGDQRSDRDEWVAATVPTDSLEYLSLFDVQFSERGGSNSMGWDSSAGRHYCIEFSRDLNKPWQQASDWLEGTGSTMSFQHQTAPADDEPIFYRVTIRVQQ